MILSGDEFIAEQFFVKLFDGIILLLGLCHPLAELSECVFAFRLGRLDSRLEDGFGELAFLVHLAEYLADLAND
ncbi:MAG: hypothetical protein M3R15_07225 [Acidobacteriota bacterium]|nr:hypothetical protein [Acidobacteriota bacterium]